MLGHEGEIVFVRGGPNIVEVTQKPVDSFPIEIVKARQMLEVQQVRGQIRGSETSHTRPNAGGDRSWRLGIVRPYIEEDSFGIRRLMAPVVLQCSHENDGVEECRDFVKLHILSQFGGQGSLPE